MSNLVSTEYTVFANPTPYVKIENIVRMEIFSTLQIEYAKYILEFIQTFPHHRWLQVMLSSLCKKKVNKSNVFFKPVVGDKFKHHISRSVAGDSKLSQALLS